ncbi:NACHT, LRR and PYD domains-containing protein 5-like [Gymnodraco acuticeps]|uniref:NACHT, LRR and PYD domains-containing protein 5-like n=1 Tax=Gymnodraco acuticeps TaxID=8218 RepID=A0A6P8VJ48_GYMAC|nr:NACHT, LRR and PYD domains-containing protein 5-like [Gymnodraco acuticeps]XP_034086511.1 NACHT, LRR and PYD domains-containing protein 5-like [Gymnodraco acuticeps]
MSEKRKTRKSSISDQPISSEQSSQMNEDESTAPSISASDRSKDKMIYFSKGLKRSLSSESAAPSDALSYRSMGQPLSFNVKKSELTEEPVRKKPKKDLEPQREAEEDPGGSHLLKIQTNHRNEMLRKFAKTSEGNGDQESSLDSIYTELIISTGESEGPHEEHSFRRQRQPSSVNTVHLNDIFRHVLPQDTTRRIVLTKGVARIGKSFSVQKFILDWAEGKANQDFEFVFSLAFRELNLIRGNKSLLKLLTDINPALQHLKESEVLDKAKVLVILDGLDESRIKLDFENKPVKSVTEETSVGNLLASLIQGNLLPNANLWITSRPAAANQIPAKYVSMVTEIRGFNDSQKEEYFRRRFRDDVNLPEKIISHIRSSQTLDIMCQIPIFCWISGILFKEIFAGDEKAQTPQTLTEMMAHYLLAQTKRSSRKYDKKTERNKERLLKTQKEFLLKLGKLAFVQLQNNNIIFYDEDLKDCGIDLQEATIYSGFCSTVLREEDVISQKKVFFFVHLTIQEFFAAFFVYECFISKNTKELGNFLDWKDQQHTLYDLMKMTVDKVLEEQNGQLDFFLRFLLGLLVEPNRRVLEGLLTSPDLSQDTDKKILTHLKALRRKALSPESCINLFQSMVEMRDNKVKDEIQEYLKKSDRSKTELTPLYCSALAYMLQVSKDQLDLLELKSFNTSDEGRRRLIPAVRISRKAILADCKVTEEWVKHLSFGLKFPYSPLRDLDLSNNDLKVSGVKLLCDGLSNAGCRLERLSLSGCQVTEKGCTDLASALKSNPSHLIELDLSYNNLGDSGEKLMSELKENTQYKLSKLPLEHGGSHRMIDGLKKYACELTLDPNTVHKNLLLSEGNRKVTWVEVEQPHPDHEERFVTCQQVLCEQALDGRSYWEMEVLEPFMVGLTYKSIGREGHDGKLESNDKSWCLFCSNDGCFVTGDGEKVSVTSHHSRSSRVGVYLDWPAGNLSFYRVSSDIRTRLHTFKTTFNAPLYPAVGLHTVPKNSQSFALFC